MWDFLADALRAGAVYAALTLMQIPLRRIKPLHAMRYALNLLFAFAVATCLLAEWLQAVHPYLRTGAETAFFSLLAFVGIRLLDTLLFDAWLNRRQAAPVPVVLRDMLKWILAAVAIFLILRTLFPALNLSVLAFSSIVVGYILGNASQDTLGNLIAGLALNTERPFAIGDWVQLGEFSGRVTDMTWRATRMRTKMRDHIIIPNATIAREAIVNYSQPTRCHGFTVAIGIQYEEPPNRVRRILLAACAATPGILSHPPPEVWLSEYDDFAIRYVLKFFIDDFEQLETIRNALMNGVWYHFKREGIVIPFPIRDVRPMEAVAARAAEQAARSATDNRALLDAVPLLQPLSETERARVCENLREAIYADGEIVVREGSAGHTFYIVKQGRVRISIGSAPRHDLATLARGDCFGEMSLLTGEKRNATVTAEGDVTVLALEHDSLRELLAQNADLAAALAVALEARMRSQLALQAKLSAAAAAAPSVLATRQDLLGRIRRFFHL